MTFTTIMLKKECRFDSSVGNEQNEIPIVKKGKVVN